MLQSSQTSSKSDVFKFGKAYRLTTCILLAVTFAPEISLLRAQEPTLAKRPESDLEKKAGDPPNTSDEPTPLQEPDDQTRSLSSRRGANTLKAKPQNSPTGIDAAPASFQKITPGISSRNDLKAALGPAQSKEEGPNRESWIYEIGPFPRVEFWIAKNLVQRIFIELEAPRPATEIIKELGLENFAPALIPDADGSIRGHAIPERGVILGFAEGSDPPEVSEIVLDTITSEPFVVRAQQDLDHRYSQSLADLTIAQSLDPKNSEAFWLEANLLAAVGQYNRAITAVRKAIEIEPRKLDFQLTLSSLLRQIDEIETAIATIQPVITNTKSSDIIHLQAKYLLADLRSQQSIPDYQESMRLHSEVIDAALAMALSNNSSLRQTAKGLLVDAHLGMATTISYGVWSGKEKVIPKWTASARQLAEHLITQDEGDSILRLTLASRTLNNYAAINGAIDPSQMIEWAMDQRSRLIQSSPDSLFLHQVNWESGKAALFAAITYQARGKSEEAKKYAEQADSFFETASADRDATPQQNYLRGKACFVMGSLIAIHDEDHSEAIVWYEKTQPFLDQKLPQRAVQERGQRAEWLVSMGVSYWNVHDYENALRLTRQGAEDIEKAVHSGELGKESLALVYENLVAMYRKIGDPSKADDYSTKAQKIARQVPPSKRR